MDWIKAKFTHLTSSLSGRNINYLLKLFYSDFFYYYFISRNLLVDIIVRYAVRQEFHVDL